MPPTLSYLPKTPWLDRFWGLQCPLCEQSGRAGELCELCRSWLQPLVDPCPGCGTPNTLTLFCGRCQRKPPAWRRLHLAWPLTGASRFLIHQMKYHQDYATARALAGLWWSQMASKLNLETDAFLAVPQHRTKLDQRGFNQASWLAKLWSRSAAVPVWQGVRKVRATPALEGLNRRQRKATLAGVFEVTQPVPKRLVIVDDVFTSGATTAELSATLLRAGVQTIDVWTLARTPLGD
ncbi:ComF family protein [Saccharospirillum mangrovi]|uniref:ComF family protein n=1 Tax=Saccharospirillum mangrovi TaxID=2161747 RepID=UPI000D37CF9D|nr:ComF family protein [Saccharospirillum mangrovi]